MTTETKETQSGGVQLATRANMDILGRIGGAEPMGQMAFMPRNFSEVAELSKLMSTSGLAVRKHLRSNPGACVRIVLQALRWGMDPFAVASKSYEVNGELAFEAQLINAVVNTSGVLVGRLHVEWEGEGKALHCRVTGFVRGDDRPKTVSQSIAPIRVKNSPLWVDAPEQQLAYYTTRMWARLYVPEVLLGVYTPEEIRELIEAKALPVEEIPERPKRSDYETPSSNGGFPPNILGNGEESPKDEPKAETASNPPSAPEPAVEPDFQIVDGDGELHDFSSIEDAASALCELIQQARTIPAINGLVESNLPLLGKMPEIVEAEINREIAQRQAELKKGK